MFQIFHIVHKFLASLFKSWGTATVNSPLDYDTRGQEFDDGLQGLGIHGRTGPVEVLLIAIKWFFIARGPPELDILGSFHHVGQEIAQFRIGVWNRQIYF